MREQNSFPIMPWPSNGSAGTVTGLCLLCCVMLLNGCDFATRMAFRASEVPAALFDTGFPSVIENPDTATEADLAIAYPETAAAWEACAVNLREVESIVNGMK